MRKFLKWLSITLVGLVGLAVIAVALMYMFSERRLNRTYAISPESVPISIDATTLARGEHLARTRGCTDCHGDNLAGGVFLDDPAIGQLFASNLTSGQGGIGARYTDADWVRAIRHGVGPDGKPLLFMPAQEFYYLSDEDLGALISYLKTIPAVDNILPQNSVGPIGRIMSTSCPSPWNHCGIWSLPGCGMYGVSWSGLCRRPYSRHAPRYSTRSESDTCRYACRMDRGGLYQGGAYWCHT